MAKKKLTFRIWLLIIVLALSLISIFGLPPAFTEKGVLITSIDSNSTEFAQGLRQGQIITHIDGQEIFEIEEFTKIVQGKFPSNQSVKTIINTKDVEVILFSNESPQMIVSNIPKTNIKAGLDLAGGSTALVQAEDRKLTKEEINDLVAITTNRLNVYGLSDIKVSPISDLSRNHFMRIEIAGASPKDLKEMIENQGEFKAKIGNDTVFIGGDRDIPYVCQNDGTCAGIEPCQESQGTFFCKFHFTIYLSEDAAERHADITNSIELNTTNPGYLAKPLDLYLDDQLVDTLLISEGLKGQAQTQISISGSGSGETEEVAIKAAEEQMHKLQTVLITGSLPYKLEIVKLDTISPVLGKEFVRAILFAALAALVMVVIIIFIRYKRFKSSMALLFTSISEIIIILGVASFIDWNLDLLSIAGILATIGTGIDQQIIILDESRQKVVLSMKQKLKRAFSIILGAYFTAVVALIPLLWAGAGLLKGFAITTIIGITVGVLITRPAFTDMIQLFEK